MAAIRADSNGDSYTSCDTAGSKVVDFAPESVNHFSFHGSSIVPDQIGVEGPSFRLLRIVPGPFEGEMYCDLVRRPIYDAGLEYSALNYSWGVDEASSTIFIDPLSQRFKITRYLLSALRRLRCESRPVYVWVDAICINQMDLEEKAAQIPLMSQIFNQAKDVVVWLGEGVTAELISLWKLCNRPNLWWTRLWILQEILYAASEPKVLLESCKIPMSVLLTNWWPVIDLGISFLIKSPEYYGSELQARKDILVVHESFKEVSQLYDAWIEQNKAGVLRKPLIEWVRSTASRRCTEPVDKVYALLNIIPEKEAHYFQPDYREAPVELLNEVIHYHLHKTSWKLPALQQLVDDLRGTRTPAADLFGVRKPATISYDLLANPENPKHASTHISWCFDSIPELPMLQLSPVDRDKVSYILRCRTADRLSHDLIRYNLSWNETAIKQALTSYFKHVVRAMANLANIIGGSQLPEFSTDPSASLQTLSSFRASDSARWESYLEDDTRACDFGALIVAYSGVVGIQLPDNSSHAEEADHIHFTVSGGLGHVTQDGQLKTMCFVPHTQRLQEFLAADCAISETTFEITLPKHARLTLDPTSILL